MSNGRSKKVSQFLVQHEAPMTKGKITYKLGLSMRGNGQVTNYPKKTRLLVSRLVDAKERRQPAVIAQVLGELGTLFEETEDWPQTLKYARQELENAKLLPVSKRMEVQSQALYRMGRACRELGEFDACLKYQNEYLNVSEKLNNPQEKLQALMDLGVSYIGRGESEKPMPDDFRTAIDYLKKAGKQLSATTMAITEKNLLKAQLYMNLGIATKSVGDPDAAIEFLRFALNVYINAGDKISEANAYCNLAVCYEAKGDLARSIENNMLELRTHEQIKDISGAMRSLWDLTTRLKKNGKYHDARKAYQKYIEHGRLMGEDAEVEAGRSALAELDVIITKAAEIEDLNEKIRNADQAKDLRTEFRFRELRAAAQLIIERPKRAIVDMEWQKMTAIKLQLDQAQIDKLSLKLASTYILAEKYMDALNAYKEILKLPLAQEKQKRLDLLGEMAVAMKHCSPTFSQVERHFSEYLSLAEQLGRLTEQREALVELLELHRAYRYTDQARILDARLRRIDSLIESAQKDTLSDVGSIDSNIFSDFEDSVPAEPSKPLKTAFPSAVILSEDDSPIKPTKKASKAPAVSSSKSIKNKFQIRALDTSQITEMDEEEVDQMEDASGHLIGIVSPREKRRIQLESMKQSKLRKRNQIQSSSQPDPQSPARITIVSDIAHSDPPSPPPLPSFPSAPIQDTTLVPTHSSNAGPSTKGLAPSQPLSPEPFDFDYGADDYDFKESVIQSGNQENEPKQVVLDHFCEITPKKSSPPKERTPPPVACPKPSHQTPDAKPVSRRDKESNLAVTNAGVTGRAKNMKIKVIVKNPTNNDEIFAIPVLAGEFGTPRTVRWLLNETSRRYRSLYKKAPSIQRLVARDADTNEDETLFEEDLVADVVEDKQKVYAIMQ